MLGHPAQDAGSLFVVISQILPCSRLTVLYSSVIFTNSSGVFGFLNFSQNLLDWK